MLSCAMYESGSKEQKFRIVLGAGKMTETESREHEIFRRAYIAASCPSGDRGSFVFWRAGRSL